MNISVVLVVISILGISVLSIAFPLLAIFIQKILKKNDSKISTETEKFAISLAVIIPAHNEASSIAATIQSVLNAYKFINSKVLNLQIFVAADGCTDQTETIATSLGATVIEQKQSLGKWRTIKNLYTHAQNCTSAQWTALVDAGTVWPQNLLADIVQNLSDNSLVGVAPGYYNLKAKLPERLNWYIESKLKLLENFAGGPVSVHGATIFYRNSALHEAFKFLDHSSWTNDDVVIPLTIRSLNPDKKIIYRQDLKVVDQDTATYKQEKTRRTRLINGNLQWIASLWLKSFQLNPVAGCLALRRVCRVFWAYWIAAFLIAIFCYIFAYFPQRSEIFFLVSAASFAISLLLFKRSKNLLAIISASLFSPIYFLFFARKESAWK